MQRTNKPFSSIPIDLTLEQTLNADSASQRHGTRAMSNNISARQRWAQSHHARSIVISALLTNLGISKVGNVSNESSSSRIKHDHMRVGKVKDMIKEMANPFAHETEKEFLFNIATGKGVNANAEKFLLQFRNLGDEKRNRFIQECVNDPDRFLKPIPRNKIETFATQSGKTHLSACKRKYEAACLVRDVFGNLLNLAVEDKIDLEKALKYPLTPVPLALSHADGTMQKTSKSILMRHLESRIKSPPPDQVDITVVDAMFFLHIHTNLPPTFSGVAKFILQRLCELDGNTLHFVSDKWVKPSIKDSERLSRSKSSVVFNIQGPAQKTPANWQYCLKNDSFKKSLVEFLVNIWQEDCFAKILGSKNLYANSNDMYFRYFAVGDTMHREEAKEYYSTHEEADCRMFAHISHAIIPSSTVVRTSDTDCLVIALGCTHLFPVGHKIWLEVGVHSNNSQRYICVNMLHEELGSDLCRALPFFHALTGCDYTASFCRKGKVSPLKLLEKYVNIQRTFAAIPNSLELSSCVFNIVQRYVCLMYRKTGFEDVDEARYEIFLEKYKPRSDGRLSCSGKMDASLMPPCKKVLVEKVKRAHLIARRWTSAPYPCPPPDCPEEAGWQHCDGEFKILWFEGDPLPHTVDILYKDHDEEGWLEGKAFTYFFILLQSFE